MQTPNNQSTINQRLDIFLTEKGFFDSRNKASEAIKSRNIKINGKIVTKPSFLVDDTPHIEIFQENSYVSRAGNKLKEFLKENSINIKNKICLDIGSSTGGFCEVLLEYGAKEVCAVDVGSKQLHPKLKKDKRVKSFENCDIRDFQSDKKFDIITCDVSFVGISYILPKIKELSKNKIIILFKPQFEVGKDVKRDKKGVIKDKDAINRVLVRFESVLVNEGLKLIKKEISKIKGKEGNEEYFFYIKR